MHESSSNSATPTVCERCETQIDGQLVATVSYRHPIDTEGEIEVNAKETAYLCPTCRERLQEFLSRGGEELRYFN